MSALTRDQILNAQDIKVHHVDVPEWGGGIHMRQLSCAAAESYQDYLISLQKKDGQIRLSGMRVTLLTLVLCDAVGNLLFTDNDLDALSERDSMVIGRLYEEAKRINAIIEDAGDEAEKN